MKIIIFRCALNQDNYGNNDVENLLTKKSSPRKSVQENEALKNPAIQNDLIITKADNGRVMVIFTLILNTDFYRKLSVNHAIEYNAKTNTIIDVFQRIHRQ